MFNVSIVLFNPDWREVSDLCKEILKASGLRAIYLIDNSSKKASSEEISKDLLSLRKIHYIWNNGDNLGYGKAHNIAIRESIWQKTKYHLVVNSDIKVTAEDLDWLHSFMEHNSKVGSIMPKVVYPSGETQYLCKLLPTPWDVFARRFLPMKWTKKRNDRYELRESGYDKIMNVPYLSGCFMFLRTQAVLQARLFDERYFLYPEDIDLTRTIHRDWLTLFVPDITIIHNHQRASYKSWHLMWVHIINMCKYFNKWGWFFDKERNLMNQITEEQFNNN